MTNDIKTTIARLREESITKIIKILGLETAPDGEEQMFLIKSEDGEILEGVSFADEVKELSNLFINTLEEAMRKAEAGERLAGSLRCAHYDFPDVGFWTKEKNHAVLTAYDEAIK